MTYDLFIFAAGSYAVFILLLARCTGFNELSDNEDLALIHTAGSPCADRRSTQPLPSMTEK